MAPPPKCVTPPSPQMRDANTHRSSVNRPYPQRDGTVLDADHENPHGGILGFEVNVDPGTKRCHSQKAPYPERLECKKRKKRHETMILMFVRGLMLGWSSTFLFQQLDSDLSGNGEVIMPRRQSVPFLVEGLSVNVPQKLLDKFPDTKLAKLASAERPAEEEDEPIAIDVDLNHFRCLVKYMRDEKVILPPKNQVTPQSLLKVRKRFRIDDKENWTETCITEPSPAEGQSKFWTFNSNTVPFLVEGLCVNMPQTLLDEFPHCWLTKEAKWRRIDEKVHTYDDKPITINVDLIHFRFLVDFMHHGKVSLPYKSHVTKESLSKVFQSFDFDDTQIRTGNALVWGIPYWLVLRKMHGHKLHAEQYLKDLQHEQLQRIHDLMEAKKKNPKEAKTIDHKLNYLRVALFLFENCEDGIVLCCRRDHPEIYDQLKEIMLEHQLEDEQKSSLYQESLAPFGLKYKEICYWHDHIEVEVEIILDPY